MTYLVYSGDGFRKSGLLDSFFELLYRNLGYLFGPEMNSPENRAMWIRYNLDLPELPLAGNAINEIFKVYMKDTGLFVSMLEDGTQYDILQGNLFGYKGAIFENLMADIFAKMGRKLYYYHKDSGLEIDFVTRYKGGATLIEVKATTGNAKSVKTILAHPEKYHVSGAIKLGGYNIGRKDRMLTIPLYMGFLLTEY